MTTLGHGLTGIALGVLAAPRSWTRARQGWLLFLFVGLSVVPDWPLPGWGHFSYRVSHSLLVNLLLIGLAAAAYARSRRARRLLGGWPVFVFGALAWLSHFVLDAMYSHGKGVAVLWPLSDARLNLGLPWFRTLPSGWWNDPGTLASILAVEAACYGGVLVLCVVLRWLWERRRASARDATSRAWPFPRA